MRPTALRVALALAGLALLWSPTARAAEGRLKLVRLSGYNAVYEFLTGFQRESYYFPSSYDPAQVRQSAMFGERLGAAAKGSFFHPTFWSWNAALNVLLLQEVRYQRIGDVIKGSTGYGANAEFDVDSLLLERKPTPVHVFARRGTSFVQNAFARSYNVTTTTYGLDSGWQNLTAPVRVAASQTWNQFGSGSVDPGDDRFSQALADTRYESSTQSAGAEYRFYDYANSDFPNLDYQTHDLLANHTWFLVREARRKHRLDTRVHASLRSSFADRDDLQAWTGYTAQWMPKFTSRLAYRFMVSDSQATTIQNLLEASTRYDLFDSLFSGILAQGLTIRTPSGDIWQGLAGADVTYTKRLFDVVRMTHGYQFQVTRRGSDLSSTLLQASNEPATLSGVAPTLLDQPNVQLDTVQVLDAATTREYRLGTDYELLRAGDRVMLARLPGSTIPDPGSVLVSYAYDLAEDRDLLSFDHRYTGRLETIFSSHVSVWGEATERWNERQAPFETTHDRYEVLSAGATGRYRGIAVTGQVRRSKTLSFRSDEYLADASYQLGTPLLTPTFGFRFVAQRYQSLDEDRLIYEAYTEETASLPYNFSVNWLVRFFDERGGSSPGRYVDGVVALKYNFKSIQFKADYRIDASYRKAQWYENHRVFFSAGRTF